MGNNGFSCFSRLANSASFSPNAGESQSGQNVEREQQTTFSGRSTNPSDPENPYLTSLFTSQDANLRASTSATATNSIETSVSQPITQSSAVSSLENIEPPEDPFETLATYRPTSFEDSRPQLYSGFGILDDLTETYLPDGFEADFPEGLDITSQPSGQTTLASVMNSTVLGSQGADISSQGQSEFSLETASSEAVIATAIKTTQERSHLPGISQQAKPQEKPQRMRQVSRQDNNPPANNPLASYQGYASAPAPKVLLPFGKPLSGVKPLIFGPFYPSSQPIIIGPFYPPSRQPMKVKLKRPPKRPVSPPALVVGMVKVPKWRKRRPADEYLLRTDSEERPYMCGYPGCGKTYKSTGHLRGHMLLHIGVSDYRCTYPECGPNKYFPSSSNLNRHIMKVHLYNKTHTCRFCFREFDSSEILKNHVVSEHLVHQQ